MKRISRAERKQRRAEARLILDQLAEDTYRTRINDRIGSHITLWISEAQRIEWWPATRRWSCWRGNTHFGTPERLMSFVRHAASKVEVA